jgi:hypothetical protein
MKSIFFILFVIFFVVISFYFSINYFGEKNGTVAALMLSGIVMSIAATIFVNVDLFFKKKLKENSNTSNNYTTTKNSKITSNINSINEKPTVVHDGPLFVGFEAEFEDFEDYVYHREFVDKKQPNISKNNNEPIEEDFDEKFWDDLDEAYDDDDEYYEEFDEIDFMYYIDKYGDYKPYNEIVDKVRHKYNIDQDLSDKADEDNEYDDLPF